MGKKGGSTSQSSNPKWMDDAGEQLWNYSKNIVFKPSDPAAEAQTEYSNAGNYSPNGGNIYSSGTGPMAGGAPPINERHNYTQVMTPSGGSVWLSNNGTAGSSSNSLPAGSNAEMSVNNIRDLEQYGGDRVAGPVNNQNRASYLAHEASKNIVKPFDSGIEMAQNSGQRYGREFNPNTVNSNRFSASAISPYLNSFKQSALETTADEMARQAQIERLKLNSGMVSKGAFGGSRHGVVESNLNRDLLDRTGAMFRQGMSSAWDRAMSGFQQDEGRMLKKDIYNEDNRFRTHESSRNQFNTEQKQLLNAAQTLGSLGTAKSNARSQDIERLLRTGETQRNIQQQRLDNKYSDFLEQRDWPYTQLERLAGIVNGSASRGSITHQQKPSILAQLAGGAMAVSSIAKSDRRLKHNIIIAGTKNGHNLYEFSYKGSDTRYRGVMADEVKKVQPSAVITCDDGYDAVNYSAIDIPFETLGDCHA